MALEVSMTSSKFKDFLKNLKFGIANDLVNVLVKRVAVDTGNLKGSIRANTSGNVAIISMAEYAPYVEYGTPPHIIKPKKAKALHWKSGSKDIFAKVVHHPGTRPQPFIRPALREDLPRIVKENVRRHLQ